MPELWCKWRNMDNESLCSSNCHTIDIAGMIFPSFVFLESCLIAMRLSGLTEWAEWIASFLDSNQLISQIHVLETVSFTDGGATRARRQHRKKGRQTASLFLSRNLAIREQQKGTTIGRLVLGAIQIDETGQERD
jgi:hypothetical protein